VDASNVAVDQTGSVVALDTNKGLFLITLDRPDHIVNILRHKSKKKHRVVRWNPHSSMSTILAMSDNNVCKVWDVRKHKAQTSLKQHTALISDMCFSLIKKNILATCSKDSHTLIWDIRSNSKRSVKCVASTKPPSSKVLFHPNLEHILATANGPDISIWDTRKSSESVNTFRAHSVAGVDNFIWLGVELGLLSFGKEEKILKLFDASSKSDTLRQSFSFTSYPLQQVLRVPFSRRFSLLTTSQRGDHQIRLWTNNLVLEEEKKNPLHVMASGNFERCHAYIGHSSTVVSCDWRIRGNQRQIVSWSTDRHLSLWQVHESHLRPQEEGSRDVPKRPDNVVIQTASPKVESSKGFSFDLDSMFLISLSVSLSLILSLSLISL
jgi:WD40 repeat protein